ncbi:MAG: GntR family transcriptional regulator [Eubacteriales bacterium]
MRVIIKNTAGVPIYEQIKEQIKEAILGGELNEGDMLPSIRELARDLRISVITTTRAYSDLEKEGFITIVQGKGCFVLPKNSDLVREQLLKKIEDSFTAAIVAGRTAKLTREDLIKILDVILEENRNE